MLSVAFLPGSAAHAVTSERVHIFRTAEIAFADQVEIPVEGWTKRDLPSLWLSDEARQKLDGTMLSAWARMRFDADQAGAQPLALYTDNNRERLTVFLNGVELYRNYSGNRSQTLGWNRTYLVPLPSQLLRQRNNEVVLKVEAGRQYSIGVGEVKVGSQNILGPMMKYNQFWRITGAMAANYAMLFLTLAALLMWIVRRSEAATFWLFMTGLCWFIRDYHFFAEEAPFDPYLFQQVSYNSIFFAVASSLSFCAQFMQLPRRKAIITTMFGVAISLCTVRIVGMPSDRTDLATSLVTLLMSVVMIGIMFRAWLNSRKPEHAMLLAIVVIVTVLGLHDIGRIPNVAWWDGLGFHIQPYTGFLLFCVFLLSLGRRFVGALSTVEELNAGLEQRVEAATDALAQSEAARHKMEVERAVGLERERLMREMHDGIGSNLVTALAVVRNEHKPQVAVETLQRAITDLKLTVDSLAPVEGDVVALLANLRHRMEPDLERAGVQCVWRVQSCPPLPWLDAPNALHMLRIIQEGISNILAHAKSTQIIVGCEEQLHGGQQGIEVSLSDDGKGFAADAPPSSGRGLANMRSRAEILLGHLDISSMPGKGTSLRLWLPLNQPRPT